jgi:hypothetical protein
VEVRRYCCGGSDWGFFLAEWRVRIVLRLQRQAGEMKVELVVVVVVVVEEEEEEEPTTGNGGVDCWGMDDLKSQSLKDNRNIVSN